MDLWCQVSSPVTIFFAHIRHLIKFVWEDYYFCNVYIAKGHYPFLVNIHPSAVQKWWEFVLDYIHANTFLTDLDMEVVSSNRDVFTGNSKSKPDTLAVKTEAASLIGLRGKYRSIFFQIVLFYSIFINWQRRESHRVISINSIYIWHPTLALIAFFLAFEIIIK